MENLKGKRLLLLGGTSWRDAIADFAKDNGIVLVAASNDPNAKFFEIAQESYVVSSTDADAMKKLIRDKKIDGVHMGGSEAVMNAACKYLHELGLPCYCTEEQLKILHNKENFKKLCEYVGLPVVPQIKVDEDNLQKSAEKIIYPVITKPVDGCGSIGFSICRNPEDFLVGYEKARQNSRSEKVIVENLVDNSSAYPFYTFSNGEVFFSGFSKRYTVQYKETESSILGVILFESPYTSEFRQLFESKLKAMFKKMNIREGNLFMETFHDGQKYYFNECGYRYAGTLPMYYMDYFFGINQLHADIYYSLTGESMLQGHKSLIPPNFKRKKYYAVYAVHLKPGKIVSITGIDKISARDDVVIAADSKSIGDKVELTGTFAQIFALVHFVFDTKEDFIDVVNDIHEKIIVEDERGENLVNKMLDIETVTTDFFETHKQFEENRN